MAMFGMAFTAGFPLGSLIQGELADLAGVRPVVGAAGVLLIAYAAWLRARADGLRSLDHPPEENTSAAPPR